MRGRRRSHGSPGRATCVSCSHLAVMFRTIWSFFRRKLPTPTHSRMNFFMLWLLPGALPKPVTPGLPHQASSKVPAAVSLNVLDISMALRNMDQGRAADEMAQLISWWQSRVSGIQNARSSRGM